MANYRRYYSIVLLVSLLLLLAQSLYLCYQRPFRNRTPNVPSYYRPLRTVDQVTITTNQVWLHRRITIERTTYWGRTLILPTPGQKALLKTVQIKQGRSLPFALYGYNSTIYIKVKLPPRWHPRLLTLDLAFRLADFLTQEGNKCLGMLAPGPVVSQGAYQLQIRQGRTLLYQAHQYQPNFSFPLPITLHLQGHSCRQILRPGVKWAVLLAVLLVGGLLYALLLRYGRRRGWSGEILLLIYLGGFLACCFQPILLEDNLSYWAYAVSALLDHDLQLYNQYYLHNPYNIFIPPLDEYGPTGAAIMHLPWLCLGHVLVTVINALGGELAPDGMSFVYIFVLGLGCFLYGVAALLLIYRWLRRWFAERLVFWGLVIFIPSTNMFMMLYMWTGSTYMPSLFLFALFVWWREKVRLSTDLPPWFLLGFIGGLMAQTRFQNSALLVLSLVDLIVLTYQNWRTRNYQRIVWLVLLGLCFSLAVLLAFSPQVVVWKAFTGHLFEDIYHVQEQRFTNPLPRLGHMLFGREDNMVLPNGLLTSMPIWALVLIGFCCWSAGRARLLLEAALIFISQFFIVLSYEEWFGKLIIATPYLITISPFLVAGLVNFLEHYGRFRKLLLFFCLTSVGINLYSIYLQQAFEQMSPLIDTVPFGRALEALIFLPDTTVHYNYLARSGEACYFLRNITLNLMQGAWDRLGLTLLVLLASASVLLLPLIISRLARRIRWQPAWWASLLIIGWSLIDYGICTCVRNTDNRYQVASCDQYLHLSEELVLLQTSPTRPLYCLLNQHLPCAHLDLFTFLQNGANLAQGTKVALVELLPYQAPAVQVLLRAGIQTADYRIAHPTLALAHQAPAGIKLHWRIRDQATLPYLGSAYHYRIALPHPCRLRALRVTYLAEQGVLCLYHSYFYLHKESDGS